MGQTEVRVQTMARNQKVYIHQIIPFKIRLEQVDVGSKIDVRDTEYIWCIGLVKIKIESAHKELLLVIHYEGWNKYFDEIIS